MQQKEYLFLIMNNCFPVFYNFVVHKVDEKFGLYQKSIYLCTRFSEVKHSGCSAVRLAHLLWEQGVVGSNPATPTN